MSFAGPSNKSSDINHLTPTDRFIYFVSAHWILVFGTVFFIYVGLPFLAPVFMALGWVEGGKTIYTMYSFLCHQLPERSYFLFGPKVSYSIPEIQTAWKNTLDPIVLRQFMGSPEMGWKVAWSDRMVSMYTSTLVVGLLWAPLRKKVRQLPWWGLVLFLIPMGVDGLTHLISDLWGLGQGFRFTNTWLAELTHYAFPVSFYTGDAWGSFNAWMRLLTGILFGIGVVWFGFPYIDRAFEESRNILHMKAVRLMALNSKREESLQGMINMLHKGKEN